MKTFILLSFALMFWAFFEFSGGQDFEPVVESPFAEGREVDMTPLKPVAVAKNTEAPEPEVVLASIEVENVPALVRPAVETVPALQSEAKAESLTRPSTIVAADDVQPATDTSAIATAAEVARLAGVHAYLHGAPSPATSR